MPPTNTLESRHEILMPRNVTPKPIFVVESDGRTPDGEVHPVVAIGWSMQLDEVAAEGSLDYIDVATTKVTSSGARFLVQEGIDKLRPQRPAIARDS
jgi:hypothetical protein